MDFFQTAAVHASPWSGYTLLLFIEASLGKTKYGSIMGLAIAVLKAILKTAARMIWKKKYPPCGKENHDAS